MPYSELDHLGPDALVERFFAAHPVNCCERDCEYDERCTQIALRLAAHGTPGASWLKRIAIEAQEVFRLRAALQGLAAVEQTDAQSLAIFRVYLGTPRASFVMQAVDCLRQVGYDGFRTEVLMHATHPAAHVRSAVLRYLGHFDGRPSLPRLIAALSDPHPLVIASALGALDAVGAAPGLADRLLALLAHPSQAVRHAARYTLERNAMRALPVELAVDG